MRNRKADAFGLPFNESSPTSLTCAGPDPKFDAANCKLSRDRQIAENEKRAVTQRARDSQRFNSVRLRMLMPAKITTPKTVEQITAANSLSIFIRSLDCRIK